MNKLALAWLKMAVIYFVVGVTLGVYMGATQNFTLRPVHAHINLLGWASMALIGFFVLHFGDRLGAGLAKAQFWLHQVSAPILLVTLTIELMGNPGIGPVVGLFSVVAWVSVVLFAINVLKSLR